MKTRNKYSYAILLYFLFSFSSIATKAQDKTNYYNSVFWEVSGNGLEKKSYLFGTIHLIPEKEYKFDEIVWNKFDSCNSLILEIDVDISLNQQIEIAKKMLLPDGKTLENFMTAEQYSAFQNYLLDSLKLHKSTLRKVKMLKPIFSSAIIINDLLDDPVTTETEFSKVAKKQKKQLTGLETIEFQLSLFDSISIEKQIEMLLTQLANPGPIEEYNKMLAAYKQEDLKKIFETAQKNKDFKLFEKDFFIKRNNRWIGKIKEIVNKESSFIAIGAAHLYGENGLVSLLRKEGYTVKAVR